MDDVQNQEDLVFTSDQLQRLILQSIQLVLTGKIYQEAQVSKWINLICQDVMKKLVQSQKPYKYITNCLIQQKLGAPVIGAFSCLWDSASDLNVSIVWPKDKPVRGQQAKPTLQCIVSVCAISGI